MVMMLLTIVFSEIAELNDSTVMYSWIVMHVLLQESVDNDATSFLSEKVVTCNCLLFLAKMMSNIKDHDSCLLWFVSDQTSAPILF